MNRRTAKPINSVYRILPTYSPGPGAFIQQGTLGLAFRKPQEVEVIEPGSAEGGILKRFGGSGSQGLYPTKQDATLVHQQVLTNCPLPAALSAIVHTDPDKIKSLIRSKPGRKPVSIHYDAFHNRNNDPLKYKPINLYEVSFRDGRKILVSGLIYFQGSIVYAYSSDRTAWVPLIEKAYVLKFNNTVYEDLDKGTGGLSVLAVMLDLVGKCDHYNIDTMTQTKSIKPDDVTGPSRDTFSLPSSRFGDNTLESVLRKADTLPTVAGAKDHATKAIGWHAYTVLGMTGDKVKLREAMRDSSLSLTLLEFKQDFDTVIQGY